MNARANSPWTCSRNLRSPSPPGSAEERAVQNLRKIAVAERKFRSRLAVDLDQDQVGEYAYFAELAGTSPLRGGETTLSPPLLDPACGVVRDGIVTLEEYHYAIFLPDGIGNGLPEQEGGGAPWPIINASSKDPSEEAWCAYAWPRTRVEGATRAFFINQDGILFACANERANGGSGYAGSAGPAPYAAFAVQGLMGTITGPCARNARGWDGETWSIIGR